MLLLIQFIGVYESYAGKSKVKRTSKLPIN